MGQSFRINSEHTWNCFVANARALYDEHKFITFPAPRIGADRSLDQNALFHVWAREFAAYMMRCDVRDVTENQLEVTKKRLKRTFYGATGNAWMVYEETCPLTKRVEKGFTSSKSWGRGEMFEFLTWLQWIAGERGCLLESKGEYAKLQREQNQ
ncbi:hypothetical protein [Gilvimarinus chinensis]|uniref:hypothetical protein n=1 Tax=Gilvimarinus chinensis TaxID=396005 RepID=UPI00038212E7|nr:hypothetical protein [Gilvimarinus chinensis]